MVLRHGTDLILVMSGQENPLCCTGGREHYDGGLEMDTDGLETLHSFLHNTPGTTPMFAYITCLLICFLEIQQMSCDKSCKILATKPAGEAPARKPSFDLIGQESLHGQAYRGTQQIHAVLPRQQKVSPRLSKLEFFINSLHNRRNHNARKKPNAPLHSRHNSTKIQPHVDHVIAPTQKRLPSPYVSLFAHSVGANHMRAYHTSIRT